MSRTEAVILVFLRCLPLSEPWSQQLAFAISLLTQAALTSQAEENGVSLRDAATRVFSNASGSYSSNVNLAVENSSWSDEQQLQEMYLKRKSFAFNSDRCAWLLTHC